MSSLKVILGLLAAGLALSGCMPATTYQAAPEATLKPADRAQLAKARYVKVAVAEPFRRAIVDYHRRELPGSIVVDSDNHYLYLVQDGGKAIRYGVTVGEEALAFAGIAKVGNMAEWPKWTPTADIHKRIEGLPARSEEHTSELQSQSNLVCRLLLEKKNLSSAYQRSRARKGDRARQRCRGAAQRRLRATVHGRGGDACLCADRGRPGQPQHPRSSL